MRWPTDPLRWLVFADECGLADALVNHLEKLGHAVTTVRPGSGFTRLADQTYTVKPGEAQHYQSLIDAIDGAGRTPNRILHMWGVDRWPVRNGSGSFEETLDRCFYSPMFITQSLGRTQRAQPLQFTMISTNMHAVIGDELVRPEKATALGPCRVMSQEYSNIACRSVDVVLPESGLRPDSDLVERLLAELAAQSSDTVVAYRGQHRWAQTCEPVLLDGEHDIPARLRRGGVYLITGGLGGIGLSLARYLARAISAKLILLGRTTLPGREEWETWLASHPESEPLGRKMRHVLALEALGSEVLVQSADISDPRQMQTVIDHARARFGEIHGVVHAAGVAGGGVIALNTREAAAAVLAPKVQGTQVLDALFRNTKLDFMVLCSSLAAISGDPGQADYTAANAFLDAFSHRKRNDKACPTISINWDTWGEAGMALETEVPAQLAEQRRENLKNGIRSDEGVDVFCRVLDLSLPQVLVSTRDLPARFAPRDQPGMPREPERAGTAIPSTPSHARPAMATAYVAPRDPLEQIVADTWQELIGIEKVGVHDNFFDLGGHSLLAIQIASSLSTKLHVELSVNAFFDSPTVSEIAKQVERSKREQQDAAEKVARVVDMVEQLSEEEVRRLLAEGDASS